MNFLLLTIPCNGRVCRVRESAAYHGIRSIANRGTLLCIHMYDRMMVRSLLIAAHSSFSMNMTSHLEEGKIIILPDRPVQNPGFLKASLSCQRRARHDGLILVLKKN